MKILFCNLFFCLLNPVYALKGKLLLAKTHTFLYAFLFFLYLFGFYFLIQSRANIMFVIIFIASSLPIGLFGLNVPSL